MLRGFRIEQLFTGFRRALSMAAENLENFPVVDIDPEGTFKYILVKVSGSDVPDKMIVRGYKWAAYHDNIYNSLVPKIESLGLKSECVGGGRIQHDPVNKTLKVYGISTGFGKADHEVSVGLLKNVYKDYNISWSDAEKI